MKSWQPKLTLARGPDSPRESQAGSNADTPRSGIAAPGKGAIDRAPSRSVAAALTTAFAGSLMMKHRETFCIVISSEILSAAPHSAVSFGLRGGNRGELQVKPG